LGWRPSQLKVTTFGLELIEGFNEVGFVVT